MRIFTTSPPKICPIRYDYSSYGERGVFVWPMDESELLWAEQDMIAAMEEAAYWDGVEA